MNRQIDNKFYLYQGEEKEWCINTCNIMNKSQNVMLSKRCQTHLSIYIKL